MVELYSCIYSTPARCMTGEEPDTTSFLLIVFLDESAAGETPQMWNATGIEMWNATGIEMWNATGIEMWNATGIEMWNATGIEMWNAMGI